MKLGSSVVVDDDDDDDDDDETSNVDKEGWRGDSIRVVLDVDNM